MRARDFPGGSRGSVVLCFGAANPVLSFRGHPVSPSYPQGAQGTVDPFNRRCCRLVGYVWPPCWRCPKSEAARNHDDGKLGDVLK